MGHKSNTLEQTILNISFLPEWNVTRTSVSDNTIARFLIRNAGSTVVIRLGYYDESNSNPFWEVFGNFPITRNESPIKHFNFNNVDGLLNSIEEGLRQN